MLFIRIALARDDTAIVFGEDVAFGGVFRCTMVNVYFPPSNTPLTNHVVAGFGRRIWWAIKLKD